MWIHRIHSKFSAPWHLLDYTPIPRAWTHIAAQSVKSAWQLVQKTDMLVQEHRALFTPHQRTGMIPRGRDAKIKKADKHVCCACTPTLH